MIRQKLGGMASVQSLEFNLMQRVLTVVHKEGALASIEAAIRDLGMDSEVMPSNADADADADAESPQAHVKKSAQKLGWPLAVAGVGVMFVLNLGVSFALSLMTAVRAYDLPKSDLRELRRRLWHRLRTRPRDFLLPPKRPAAS